MQRQIKYGTIRHCVAFLFFYLVEKKSGGRVSSINEKIIKITIAFRMNILYNSLALIISGIID